MAADPRRALPSLGSIVRASTARLPILALARLLAPSPDCHAFACPPPARRFDPRLPLQPMARRGGPRPCRPCPGWRADPIHCMAILSLSAGPFHAQARPSVAVPGTTATTLSTAFRSHADLNPPGCHLRSKGSPAHSMPMRDSTADRWPRLALALHAKPRPCCPSHVLARQLLDSTNLALAALPLRDTPLRSIPRLPLRSRSRRDVTILG
jgi:hypothetical protein